jgi:hypothetical protein
MSCTEKTKSSRNAGTWLVPAHLALKTAKNDKIWCPGQKQPNGVCAVVGVSVLVSRAVLAGMGKQPVTWALASAPASASGRRGVVATDNPVAPASRLAVARAEGQVEAAEGSKTVGLVLSRTEDRPGCELS